MGKRLSKIVTRTGDDGSTGMADGSRVAKCSARMEAIGAVDELNSHIGVFLAELACDGGDPSANLLRDLFVRVQNDLFDLGGELSMPGRLLVREPAWRTLEQDIERLNGDLEPLANFILPGGSAAVAQCHVVRAVARRAERRYVAVCRESTAATDADRVNENSRIYLNRLSDLAFVAARWLARARGEQDVLWQQKAPP